VLEQKSLEGMTKWQKIKFLLNPFKNYKLDETDGSWQVDVSPEALRCLFYAEFISFAILGTIISLANSSWNGFDLFDNPIVSTFGNANLCVMFDDPPFSYIAGALWCPMVCTVVFYLYIDLCRVYANKVSEHPQYNEIGDNFYRGYRAVTIFIGLANFYWVEVFAVQPTQNLNLHWSPFAIWMWAMFCMGIQHYVYMLKIGLMEGSDKYWWGIAYLVFFGIWTLIKFSLDLINISTGGDLAQFEGFVVLAYVSDFLFDFSLVGLPPLIYLLFVDELDLVRLTFTAAAPPKPSNVEDGGNKKIEAAERAAPSPNNDENMAAEIVLATE